jgi:hypothetical protein
MVSGVPMISVRVRHLLGVFAVAAALPATVSAAGFPIANSAGNESTLSVAFDGTNFLVGVQGGGIRAQIVSPSGALLGSVLVPRTGDPPMVGFDGTNYLLVWGDHTSGSTVPVYGQLVSKLGAAVGSPFQISQSTTVGEVDGVAFDGTRYLVVWSNERPMGSERDIYGRFVSIAGVPQGSDFEIDDGAGVDATLAFGASSYLVVWLEDSAQTEVRGRFVTPGGTLQSVFPVNSSAALSVFPGALSFDGINFLAVWSDEINPGEYDLFAQLVSPAATLVGSPIPIATAPGTQLLPYVAFDGLNYLVTWTDVANDNGNFMCEAGEGTCLDLFGQFLDTSGTLLGGNFAVVQDPLNQGQSPVAWGAGKYLVAWTERPFTANSDVYGLFLASDPIFKDGFEG